jgi:hypothetical protein
MTLRQVAQVTGAAYSTVAAYAQKAGWTENGKRTLLDEKQVTIILEAMKAPKSSGTKANLAAQTQGIETTPVASGRKSKLLFETEGIDTARSRALRIDLLHRRIEAETQAEHVTGGDVAAPE